MEGGLEEGIEGERTRKGWKEKEGIKGWKESREEEKRKERKGGGTTGLEAGREELWLAQAGGQVQAGLGWAGLGGGDRNSDSDQPPQPGSQRFPAPAS